MGVGGWLRGGGGVAGVLTLAVSVREEGDPPMTSSWIFSAYSARIKKETNFLFAHFSSVYLYLSVCALSLSLAVTFSRPRPARSSLRRAEMTLRPR